MAKTIKDFVKQMLFTPVDESEDITRSFTHKRPDPTTKRPEPRVANTTEFIEDINKSIDKQ
jgi:hypothetical protein